MIENSSEHIINKLNFGAFNLPHVTAYIPVTTDYDYSIGKIKRYFVGRPNYESIVEVNANDYSQYSSPFFIPVKLTWKISGPRNNIYVNNILDEVGVYEYNMKIIKHANETLPNLEKLLNNPLQFWRGF